MQQPEDGQMKKLKIGLPTQKFRFFQVEGQGNYFYLIAALATRYLQKILMRTFSLQNVGVLTERTFGDERDITNRNLRKLKPWIEV